jgi:hypothetical protein
MRFIDVLTLTQPDFKAIGEAANGREVVRQMSHIFQALQAGARGYLLKGRISTEFQPILAALLPPSNRLNGSNIRHLEGNH